MKKIIRLTERDLTRLIQRVIKENDFDTDKKLHFATDVKVEISTEFLDKCRLDGDRSWYSYNWNKEGDSRTIKLKGSQWVWLGALENTSGPRFTHILLRFNANEKEIAYSEHNLETLFPQHPSYKTDLTNFYHSETLFSLMQHSGPSYYTKFNKIKVGEIDVNGFFKILEIKG